MYMFIISQRPLILDDFQVINLGQNIILLHPSSLPLRRLSLEASTKSVVPLTLKDFHQSCTLPLNPSTLSY